MSVGDRLFSDKSTTRNRLNNFSLLKYANQNRKEGLFDDITINVGGSNIRANRMVLASNSPFFETMFKKNHLEGKCAHCIEIQSLNDAAVTAIIDYFYTESISINSNTVIDLLNASNYLQVDDVQQFCYEFLESIVEPKNSIAILKSINSNENIAFKNGIYRCISEHLDDVAVTDDFQALSKTEFILCLTEGTAATASSKCHALISWTKHDHETRNKEFVELFQQLVDLKHASIELIEQSLLKEKLITENAACHEQVLTAFSLLLKNERKALSPPAISRVISIGGENTPRKIHDVYNVQAQALLTHRDFPIDIYSHSSLHLNDQVFCIGGKRGLDFFNENSLNDAWVINLKHKNPQWYKIASMNEKRSNMGAAVFQDRPVVAGGSSNATEYYEAAIDEWKAIHPMKEQRENCALVSCAGCLYAIGGKTGLFNAEIQSSVEKLENINGEWQDACPMQTQRHSFAAVECNDMIYAIGGLSQTDFFTTMKSVERYDPVANSWSYVKDMNTARCGHSACVLNGKIIVVGGKDGNLKPVSKIENYDPANDTWTVIGNISDDLFNHSLIVI